MSETLKNITNEMGYKEGEGVIMANAIVGAGGFLGSRLKWYADNYLDDEWIGINRDNYEMWETHHFDTIIWAAGSARKEDGEEGLFKKNVVDYLDLCRKFGRFKMVYISSQAVYSGPYCGNDMAREDQHLRLSNLGRYGQTKLLGEHITKHENYDRDWLIIRPNGFVGPGLKKNVIHSLAKDPPEWYYTPHSRFQIIHTDVFAAIVFMLAGKLNREIINVAIPESVTPVEVASYMGIDVDKVQRPSDRTPPSVNAVFSTEKLEKLLSKLGSGLPTVEEAISKWNEPYPIRVSDLRESLGRSGG